MRRRTSPTLPALSKSLARWRDDVIARELREGGQGVTTTDLTIRDIDVEAMRNLLTAEADIRQTRHLLAQYLGWDMVRSNDLVTGDELRVGDEWQTVTTLRLVDWAGTVGVEVRTPGSLHVFEYGEPVIRKAVSPF